MSESSYKILLRQHLKQHDNINEKLFDYVAQIGINALIGLVKG